MNHKRLQTDNFYDSHVDRPLYMSETFRDKLLQPSVLISLATILFTWFVYSTSAPEGTLWDIFVRLTPYRVLFVLEQWIHPPIVPRPMLQGTSRTYAAKSELLSKVLGMDRQGPGGGIMGTVSQVGQRGLTSVSGAMMAFKGASDSPPGLGNLDNSCYQNSILQGLASLKALPPYLSEQLSKVDVDLRKHEATDTLRSLIADLNSASNNGRTIWTPPSLKNMSTWQQQDAQEYFSKLLDEVDKEIAKTAKRKQSLPCLETEGPAAAADDANDSQHSEDSGYQSVAASSTKGSESRPPRNPLEGLMAQRVACVQCGHSDGLAMIPFNCLTLSLGLDANEHDLYELLDAYSHIESIEGVQCGKCTLLKVQRLLNMVIERSRAAGASEEKLAEPLSRLAAVAEAFESDDFEDKTITEKCKVAPAHKVNSTKTKQAVIARPPQSLVVHMNRSAFDENTGSMWKNSAAVRFPLTLDLGPWCLGSAGTYSQTADGGQNAVMAVEPARPEEEEWLLNPRSSMIAGDKGQSKVSGPIFELRAVVTHYGRHENGHYVCYRKFPRPMSTEATQAAADSDECLSNDGEHGPGIETAEPDALPEQRQPTPLNQDNSQVKESHVEEEFEMDWWRLSDETVYKVDEESVLSQGGVFMLFYDCVDSTSVLSSERQLAVRGRNVAAAATGGIKKEVQVSDATEDFSKLEGAPPLSEDEAAAPLSLGTSSLSDKRAGLDAFKQNDVVTVTSSSSPNDDVSRDGSSKAAQRETKAPAA